MLTLRLNQANTDYVSVSVYDEDENQCGSLVLRTEVWDSFDTGAVNQGDSAKVQLVPVAAQQAEGGAEPRTSRAAREDD
jgi:hypothetical protein